MSAYYNEIDPFAAQWLRNLIAAGLIAPGDVDERSVEDVQPDDLAGYTQCHFFAGIGVWSHALRSAGWADDAPVWTGSCPCQPFSAAGKRGGFDDKRHLWPAWSRLIAERAPRVVFGEQVASKDGYAWLDAVQADLEGLGYACGPVVLPAAGFGAPHGRHRIYFVADTAAQRLSVGARVAGGRHAADEPERLGDAGLVADAGRERGERDGFPMGGTPSGHQGQGDQRKRLRSDAGDGVHVGRLADANGRDSGTEREQRGREHGQQPADGGAGGLENPERTASPRLGQHGGAGLRLEEAGGSTGPGGVGGWWRDAEWLWCRDQKYRPVEPGTQPLAHGAPARVGRLRAYGNAIVAPVVAEFIRAYIEAVA